MTVSMYRDIHTLQPYIIDFTQRGCHTLRITDTLHESSLDNLMMAYTQGRNM